MEYVLAFGSPHRALKAESVLKEASVPFRLIPAPKALAKYCDLVITVKVADLTPANAALTEAGLKVKALFRKEGDDYVEV